MRAHIKREAAAIIHRKKLFGGMDPAEYHSRHAFPPGSKCAGCKTQRGLTTRVIVMLPLDECLKRDPELAAVFKAAQLDPQLRSKLDERMVQTKHGPHARISTTYSCEACRPWLEKEVAKAPSWAIVDINRGVKPGHATSGYGGSASNL